MNKNLKTWLVVFGIASIPYLFSASLKTFPAWAALQVWNSGTYEATPANTEAISLGDDNIREFKENVRKRAQVEILWGTDIAGGETGRLREGAARGFYNTACPSILSNSVTDTAGVAALGTGDDGRFCHDSDDNELKVWSGTAWEQAITKFVTPISITGAIDLLGTSTITDDGADSMVLHAHDARHRVGGTDGAWTDAADGIPFAIQQILSDTSADAGCANVLNAAIGSQVFGDAGGACFSISTGLNFTGRTGNSRIIVYGTAVASAGVGDCFLDGDILLDDLASASLVVIATGTNIANDAAETEQIVLFGYSASVSAAAHEVALHLSDSQDNDCDLDRGALYVIDLGNST